MVSRRAVSSSQEATIASSFVIPRIASISKIEKNSNDHQAIDSNFEKPPKIDTNDLEREPSHLDELVELAIDEQNRHNESDFNDSRDPETCWHSQLWWFCWRLRSDNWLRNLDSQVAFEVITAVLKEQIDRSDDDPRDLEMDAWQYHFGDITEEEAEMEMDHCWRRMKYHADFDPLTEAFSQMAMVDSLRPRLYSKLISGIMQLHRITRTSRIFLPQEKLAELLNCDQSLISRMLSRAQQEGILKLVFRGSRHTGLASIYLLLPEHLPIEIRKAYRLIAENRVVEFRPAGVA